jgi:hypothetical protein
MAEGTVDSTPREEAAQTRTFGKHHRRMAGINKNADTTGSEATLASITPRTTDTIFISFTKVLATSTNDMVGGSDVANKQEVVVVDRPVQEAVMIRDSKR